MVTDAGKTRGGDDRKGLTVESCDVPSQLFTAGGILPEVSVWSSCEQPYGLHPPLPASCLNTQSRQSLRPKKEGLIPFLYFIYLFVLI